MAKTPQQITEKYRQRLSQSGQAYQDGIRNPRRSWQQGYIGSQNRMIAGFQAAVAEGRMQRGVERVGDAGWQNAAIAKADRFTASATLAGEAYGQRAADIIAAGEAARGAANNINPDTFEQRLERATAAMRATRDYWKNRR